MRKKVVLIVSAAGLLITGSIFVIAQKAMHNGHGPFGHGGHLGGMILRGLDLTADQKLKVKEITTASRESVKPLIEQLREGHKQMAALGTDGTFDQARVEALASQQAGLISKLIVEKEKAKAQIFAILTDEQKAKAAEMRQRFEERVKNHGPMSPKQAKGDSF
jgi:protein CpxP